MFAHNPRSRIARELFWTLESMASNLRALLRLDESQSVRISHVLVLLSIYMLREEGMETFRKKIIADNIPLPKSTVYKIIDFFRDHGILKEEMGDFTCMTKTPVFLLNPDELYERPIETVGTKDYKAEELIAKAIGEFQKQIPMIIREELNQHILTIPGDPSQPAGITYPTKKPKKATVDLADIELEHRKKKSKTIKEKLGGDMFL